MSMPHIIAFRQQQHQQQQQKPQYKNNSDAYSTVLNISISSQATQTPPTRLTIGPTYSLTTGIFYKTTIIVLTNNKNK